MAIVTKYPELVEAARENGVPYKDIFMKIEETPDGDLSLKYPITTLKNGMLQGVDVDGDGDIDYPEWDQSRITAAKSFAKANDHYSVLSNMEKLGIAL